MADRFAAAMAALGPFEPAPRLAAGVSGGADSSSLALLASAWARQRGGTLLALVVDHGLRPESAEEAAVTAERLAQRGIAARLLTVSGLRRGPALAERARAARYDVLTRACAEEGILHLLLGHHAADQAETMMIRVLSGSTGRGLAGMPALTETGTLRLLRPLLGVMPIDLRALLSEAGMAWVEDPSNADQRALRPRLRRLAARNDPSGTETLAEAARFAGRQRAFRDTALAEVMAARVSIHPEGYARLTPGPLPPDALASVLQAIGGTRYAAPTGKLAALAADPRPATLGGVRLLPAGRLGAGLLLVREERAMEAPVPAVPGAIWDGRFRLAADAEIPAGATIGALGDGAARFRHHSPLPASLLRTLPALRLGKTLAVVPHLLYPDMILSARVRLTFSPSRPMAGAPFLAA